MKLDLLKCSSCGEDDAKELEFDPIKKTLFCKRCGHTVILSSVVVNAQEIENLRNRLSGAMSEKYISGEKVKGLAQDLLAKDADDLLANVCNAVYSEDSQKLNSLLDNIDCNLNIKDVEIIVEFLINDLKIENLASLKNLVSRFKLNTNYIDRIESEAEKLDDGIYNPMLKRDIFIAFAGADESRVVPIVNYFEEQGFECYFSLKNLRHGANAKEVYWKELYKALGNCKCVVFCSSNNSRKNSCDALTELAYVSDTLNKKDNMGIGMFEFILDEYTNKTPLLMKNTLKEYFENKTYYTDLDALGATVFKFIQSKKIDRTKKTVEAGSDEVASTLNAVPKTAKTPIPVSASNANNEFEIDGTKLMKYIGNSARVGIPKGVTFICSDAFSNCSKVTSIFIPGSVTSIGGFAFKGCSSLASIEIPSSVTSIGGFAFKDCSSLASIQIPNSVTSMGSNTFCGCSNLTIECEACAKPRGWDSAWNSDNRPIVWDCKNGGGRLFNQVKNAISKGLNQAANVITKATDAITQSPSTSDYYENEFEIVGTHLKRYKANNMDVVIPNGVTSIGNNAFSFRSLKSIVIPNSVTSISSDAFCCCSLTNISIPSSVTSIGKNAFLGCKSLTSVSIANGVTSIGDKVFSECKSLASISIPESVTSIGNDAFYCCGLTSITLPSSVTSIGKNAFFGCKGLTSIVFGGTKETWKRINHRSQWKQKGRTIYCVDGNIEC